MSAPTDLVTSARSRSATGDLKITSAEAAPRCTTMQAPLDGLRLMHREFVSPNQLCPLFRSVGAFVVLYGVC